MTLHASNDVCSWGLYKVVILFLYSQGESCNTGLIVKLPKYNRDKLFSM